MSQSSKPRSRKSKLIPRRSLDSEDENIYELQNDIDMEIRRMKTEILDVEYEQEFNVKIEPNFSENICDTEFTIEPELNLSENVYDNEFTIEPQLNSPSSVELIDDKDFTVESPYLSRDVDDKEFDNQPPSNLSDSIYDQQSTVEPQLKFSIKVEVEEFDDYRVKIENENEEVRVNKQLIEENSSIEPHDSDTHEELKEIEDNQSEISVDDVIVTFDDDALYTFLGDATDISSEADRIFKNGNYGDKFLAMEMKNRCGMLGKAQESTIFNQDLCAIFKQWKVWNASRNYSQEPLFYKCYICSLSWWYLGPFVEHAKEHDTAKNVMYLEKCSFRCSIVLANFRGEAEKFIDTPGNCWRCDRPFEFHVMKDTDRGYKCVGCKKTYHTCSRLAEHEKTCLEMREPESDLVCSICKRTFKLRKDLNRHRILSHTVRSDLPIIPTYKICNGCYKKYHFRVWHHCPKFGYFRYICKTCLTGFPVRSLYNSHISKAQHKVKCKLCNTKIKQHCQEIPHYVSHSKDIVSAHKCTKCTEVFLVFTKESMQRHMMLWHKQKYNVKKHSFELVLLPVKCMKFLKKIDVKLIDLGSPESNEDDCKENCKKKELTNEVTSFKNDKILEEAVMDTTEIKIEVDESFDDLRNQSERMNLSEENMAVYNRFLANILGEPSESGSQINFKITAEVQDHNDDVKLSPNDCSDDDDRLVIDTQEQQSDDEGNSMEPEVILKPSARFPRIYKCNKCDYEGVHREYREHRSFFCSMMNNLKGREVPKTVTCNDCTHSFSSNKAFILHLRKHGYEQFQCPLCLLNFDRLQKLMGHMNHHIVRGYLKFKTINSHNASKKIGVKLKCKECQKTVPECEMFSHWVLHFKVRGPKYEEKNKIKMNNAVDRSSLVPGRLLKDNTRDELICRLMWIGPHQADQKTCIVCNRAFGRLSDSKRHLIEHLLVDAFATKVCYNGLRCQICGELLPKVEKYKRHMREHASLPIYKCELCDKTFSDSSNFVKHKKVHNLEAVVCDICKKKFQMKSSLEKHIQMHAETEPIPCKLCKKTFFTESAYKKHHKSKHEKRTSQFRCQICGLYFVKLKDKWDHLWLVHNERRQKADCPVCTQKFRKMHDLKSHLREEHDPLELKQWQLTSRDGGDVYEFIKKNSGSTLGESKEFRLNAL